MPPAEWVMPMLEPQIVTFVQAERLEGRASAAEKGYLLDLQGWVGTDARKFWVKIKGDGVVGGDLEELEVQALYSRMIGSFFDLQLGMRQDTSADKPRTHAVVGIQGLAPYWFEIDAAAVPATTTADSENPMLPPNPPPRINSSVRYDDEIVASKSRGNDAP